MEKAQSCSAIEKLFEKQKVKKKEEETERSAQKRKKSSESERIELEEERDMKEMIIDLNKNNEKLERRVNVLIDLLEREIENRTKEREEQKRETEEVKKSIEEIKIKLNEKVTNTKLEEISEKLGREMMGIKEEMKDLKENINKDKQEWKQKMNTLQEESHNMKEKMGKIEQENREERKKLEQLENKTKERNIIITGVKQSRNETENETYEKVKEIINEELGMQTPDIAESYRLGEYKGRDRPILVMMENKWDKREIIRNKAKLRGTNIYINDDLAKETRYKNKLLREEAKKVREEGKIARIKNQTLIIEVERYEWDEEKGFQKTKTKPFLENNQ